MPIGLIFHGVKFAIRAVGMFYDDEGNRDAALDALMSHGSDRQATEQLCDWLNQCGLSYKQMATYESDHPEHLFTAVSLLLKYAQDRTGDDRAAMSQMLATITRTIPEKQAEALGVLMDNHHMSHDEARNIRDFLRRGGIFDERIINELTSDIAEEAMARLSATSDHMNCLRRMAEDLWKDTQTALGKIDPRLCGEEPDKYRKRIERSAKSLLVCSQACFDEAVVEKECDYGYVEIMPSVDPDLAEAGGSAWANCGRCGKELAEGDPLLLSECCGALPHESTPDVGADNPAGVCSKCRKHAEFG